MDRRTGAMRWRGAVCSSFVATSPRRADAREESLVAALFAEPRATKVLGLLVLKPSLMPATNTKIARPGRGCSATKEGRWRSASSNNWTRKYSDFMTDVSHARH